MEQVIGIAILVVVALVSLVILRQCTYRVKYPDGAIVTVFGEIRRVDVLPGLKFRLPPWIKLGGKSIMEVIHEPGGKIPFSIGDEKVLTRDGVNANLGVFLTFTIIRDDPTPEDLKRNRILGLMNPDALQRFYSFMKPENTPSYIQGLVRGAATLEAVKHNSRFLPAATEPVRAAIDSKLEAASSGWGVTYEVQVTEFQAPTTTAAQERVVAAEVEREYEVAKKMGQAMGYVQALKYLVEHKPDGITTRQWDDTVATFLRGQNLHDLPRGTNLNVFSGLSGLFGSLFGGIGDVMQDRLNEKFSNPAPRSPRSQRSNINKRARKRGSQ